MFEHYPTKGLHAVAVKYEIGLMQETIKIFVTSMFNLT